MHPFLVLFFYCKRKSSKNGLTKKHSSEMTFPHEPENQRDTPISCFMESVRLGTKRTLNLNHLSLTSSEKSPRALRSSVSVSSLTSSREITCFPITSLTNPSGRAASTFPDSSGTLLKAREPGTRVFAASAPSMASVWWSGSSKSRRCVNWR